MYETLSTTPRRTESAVAYEREIKAAIRASLRPRRKPGSAKHPDLGRIGKNGMPVGRPLGVSTGLPIYMAICYVFQQNEKAKKRRKLTDYRIAEWLRHEFPGRGTAAWDRVQEMRKKYNAGAFTRGYVPKHPSHRYDSGGEITDPKRQDNQGKQGIQGQRRSAA
jgi:hypothetical protein